MLVERVKIEFGKEAREAFSLHELDLVSQVPNLSLTKTKVLFSVGELDFLALSHLRKFWIHTLLIVGSSWGFDRLS